MRNALNGSSKHHVGIRTKTTMSAQELPELDYAPLLPTANDGKADTSVYRVLITGENPKCAAMTVTPGTAYGAYYAAVSEWPDVSLVLKRGTKVLARFTP